MILVWEVFLLARLALGSLQEPRPTPNGRFGPDKCVELSRSVQGSCVLSTQCSGRNISGVDFAFVCLNPGSDIPRALHSFGRGGFLATETFDTAVDCQRCVTVDAAFDRGTEELRGALQSMPLGRLLAPEHDEPEARETMRPDKATFFGPKACMAAFKSPAGTCILQTRCAKSSISQYDAGITCLDKAGDYTRYLFGKGSFDAEETFDTRLECQTCLGVGDESHGQMHALLPKQLVEDVNALKREVQALRTEVDALQVDGATSGPEIEYARKPAPEPVSRIWHQHRRRSWREEAASDGLAPAPSMAAAPSLAPTMPKVIPLSPAARHSKKSRKTKRTWKTINGKIVGPSLSPGPIRSKTKWKTINGKIVGPAKTVVVPSESAPAPDTEDQSSTAARAPSPSDATSVSNPPLPPLAGAPGTAKAQDPASRPAPAPSAQGLAAAPGSAAAPSPAAEGPRASRAQAGAGGAAAREELEEDTSEAEAGASARGAAKVSAAVQVERPVPLATEMRGDDEPIFVHRPMGVPALQDLLRKLAR